MKHHPSPSFMVPYVNNYCHPPFTHTVSNLTQVSFTTKKVTQYQLAPMGFLAPVSTTLRSAPKRHQRNCFWRTCLQRNLQTSPTNFKKAFATFRNPRTTSGNHFLCPTNYSIVRGKGQSPKIVGGEILIFLWIRSPCKSILEKSYLRGERKNKTVNSGHYILSATSKGSAHTSLRPTSYSLYNLTLTFCFILTAHCAWNLFSTNRT